MYLSHASIFVLFHPILSLSLEFRMEQIHYLDPTAQVEVLRIDMLQEVDTKMKQWSCL